ncbi:hypothetical protein EDB83DRAFT_2523720 [Lactarius deliciosus]|nr:hypothetical protein EDB83DRAFT_2523720 [Lactarius deliciosus]
MAPESDTVRVRPKHAAKEAALKNPVWLSNRKAPTSVSTSGEKKRHHSPDGPSASTKKARNLAGVKSLSKAAKSGNHVTMQPPVNAKAKTHPPDNSAIPRRHPVQIDVNAESDDNGGNEDSDQPESDEGEAMQPESEGEDVSSEDQDDLCNLGPKDLHAAFERERAKWGTDTDPLPSFKRAKWGIDADVNDESDTNAVGDSHINPFDRRRLKAGTAGDNNALSDDENCDKDKSTEVRVIGNRAAKRLAEVPKWDNPGDSDGTHTSTGTPFSSDGEDNNNAEQIPIDEYMVNKIWSKACHYIPTDHGLVQLRIQPPDLRAIMRLMPPLAITDIPSISRQSHCIIQPLRIRFFWDHEIGKALGRVLSGRVSTYRGQLKRTVAGKVEGYYRLLEGPECVERVRGLIRGSVYVYPTKEGPSGQQNVVKSKPFGHPIIMAVLREAFFMNIRGGSYASKYCGRFKSSLPDSHPSELEIPCAMLALVATSIHSALDDHSTGIYRRTEFNADLYEDIYIGHNSFLSHIRDGSIKKYHRMMSDLYNQASAVAVMSSMSVTNDAIAELDLDGMAE